MDTTMDTAPGDGIERRTRDEAERASGDTRSLLSGPRNVGELERVVSVVGGGALALLGARRRGIPGAAMALLGAALVHRGTTGHCPVYGSLGVSTADGGRPHLRQQHGPAAVLDASKAVRVEHAVTIARPREELYRYWRQLENLPRIMRHLESVTVLDERRSHWRAKAPAGQSVEWDAVIHNEVENEILAWKSEGEATVPNAGSVHFADSADGRGTLVTVVLEYAPPAGTLGRMAAKLFHEEPDVQVREDLQRFKEAMEGAGEGAGS